MQPTPQQHDAIHIHDKNLIVVAGAGSGKTRVLVERYLTLLDTHPDWHLNALVAITFTREAAFEMRNRVRKSLEHNVRASTNTAQATRWTQLLSEMDTARIDTIHGLCVTILRANAAQAGIDPKFEVLDEVEASILLEEIVGDTLSTLEPPLTRLFSEYESRKVIETLANPNLINSDISPVPDSPQALLQQWRDEWSTAVHHIKQTLLDADITHDVYHGAPSGGYPVSDKLGQLYMQYCDYLDTIRTSDNANDILQLMIECHETGTVGRKGSAKIWGDAKEEYLVRLREFRNFIKSLTQSIGGELNAIDEASSELLPLWYQLLMRVQTTYRQHKYNNSLLDFDDLERLTAHLLDDDTVRARYRDNEFKHLLVDEFQDTNSAQWRIIKSLASLDHGGAMFVVGDPKQSIYQFRGADVSVFNSVRDEIATLETGDEIPLSMSFRTHKRLVDLFNSLFAELLVRDESSPVKQFQVVLDNDMTAFRQESPSDPVIECLLLDQGIRDENGNYQKNKKTNRIENYPSEDMRRWEAYEIAQYIKTAIDNGREIPYFDGDKTAHRPITTGDIAILFQSMSNVTLYEDVFKSQGLQFMTIAGRGYYSRQEVWDMLDLLRALHNPADNLSLATVLRSPMFSFSDDILFALRRITDEHPDKPKPIRLWDALTIGLTQDVAGITTDDKPLLQFAIDTLHSLHDIAGRVTISELLRQAIAQTGYLAILTGLPDGARRRGNIEKLLQLAETSGKITLGKFSKYLNDLSTREIREGEAIIGDNAAIKLMTVHASKGLEFPVVILADTSWSRGNAVGGAALMNDTDYGLSCQIFDPEQNKYVSGFTHNRNTERLKFKEEAERKRLLYVAATRAKDFLVISGRVGRSAPDKPWSTRGEWLKELMRVFDLNEIDFLPDQTYPFADDVIRVIMPPEPPPQNMLYADAVTDVNLWGFDADESDFPPLEPALIQPIHIAQSEQIKHISATQIADIGGFKYAKQTQRAFYKQRFRHQTLHDTSSQILSLSEQQQSPVSQRIIGEIVHEVIRYWKFDLPPKEFNDMLAGYAWQHGLTQNHNRDDVIQRVTRLIDQFKKSGVYDWITSARTNKRQIYHELPFILRTEKRVIHGVMDALLRHADGTWVIIDYKTSHVKDKDFHAHAQRYYLQVGAYASAVQQQLGGIIPKTYIHYIRSNTTIEIATASWQAELDKLEDSIGELVKSDD